MGTEDNYRERMVSRIWTMVVIVSMLAIINSVYPLSLKIVLVTGEPLDLVGLAALFGTMWIVFGVYEDVVGKRLARHYFHIMDVFFDKVSQLLRFRED